MADHSRYQLQLAFINYHNRKLGKYENDYNDLKWLFYGIDREDLFLREISLYNEKYLSYYDMSKYVNTDQRTLERLFDYMNGNASLFADENGDKDDFEPIDMYDDGGHPKYQELMAAMFFSMLNPSLPKVCYNTFVNLRHNTIFPNEGDEEDEENVKNIIDQIPVIYPNFNITQLEKVMHDLEVSQCHYANARSIRMSHIEMVALNSGHGIKLGINKTFMKFSENVTKHLFNRLSRPIISEIEILGLTLNKVFIHDIVEIILMWYLNIVGESDIVVPEHTFSVLIKVIERNRGHVSEWDDF